MGEKVLFIHSQANRDSRPPDWWTWRSGMARRSFAILRSPTRKLVCSRRFAVSALYDSTARAVRVPEPDLIEAVLRCCGAMNVEGKWEDDLMNQLRSPRDSTPQWTIKHATRQTKKYRSQCQGPISPASGSNPAALLYARLQLRLKPRFCLGNIVGLFHRPRSFPSVLSGVVFRVLYKRIKW